METDNTRYQWDSEGGGQAPETSNEQIRGVLPRFNGTPIEMGGVVIAHVTSPDEEDRVWAAWKDID